MTHEDRMAIYKEKVGIEVKGHVGTWYSIDKKEYNGKMLYLMEHEEWGDMAACVIINAEDNALMMQDVHNGFYDYDYCIDEGLDPLED